MLLLLASTASANENYNLGLSLMVALGNTDRSRLGVGLDGGWHRMFGNDYPTNPEVGELTLQTSVRASLFWLPSAVTVGLQGAAGGMAPAGVPDGGFLPAFGTQAALGLAISTDGRAGPTLGGVLLGPFLEARVETTWWKGWYAPRAALGAYYPLSGFTDEY